MEYENKEKGVATSCSIDFRLKNLLLYFFNVNFFHAILAMEVYLLEVGQLAASFFYIITQVNERWTTSGLVWGREKACFYSNNSLFYYQASNNFI